MRSIRGAECGDRARFFSFFLNLRASAFFPLSPPHPSSSLIHAPADAATVAKGALQKLGKTALGALGGLGSTAGAPPAATRRRPPPSPPAGGEAGDGDGDGGAFPWPGRGGPLAGGRGGGLAAGPGGLLAGEATEWLFSPVEIQDVAPGG